ncbi:hypothetical protein BKA81DRAFT_597 [Phyllosticta paracitricarpa]
MRLDTLKFLEDMDGNSEAANVRADSRRVTLTLRHITHLIISPRRYHYLPPDGQIRHSQQPNYPISFSRRGARLDRNMAFQNSVRAFLGLRRASTVTRQGSFVEASNLGSHFESTAGSPDSAASVPRHGGWPHFLFPKSQIPSCALDFVWVRNVSPRPWLSVHTPRRRGVDHDGKHDGSEKRNEDSCAPGRYCGTRATSASKKERLGGLVGAAPRLHAGWL